MTSAAGRSHWNTKNKSTLDRQTCCVSIQGLHPSKDAAFVIFKGESFGETILTSSTVVKWDWSSLWSISWILYYLYCPGSQKWRSTPRNVAIISLSSFSDMQRILGCVRPRRTVVVHSPKKGKRRMRLWAAFGRAFELGQPLHGVVT